jgi:thioredoxin 1
MYSTQLFLRQILVAAAFAFAASSALAAVQAFDAKAFEAAKAAGGPVLVEVHADWCPVCKEQSAAIDKIVADPKLAGITRFRVDYDAQKPVVKSFHAKSQGTLVLFKGNKEIGRSVFETDEPKLRAFLNKAA